MNLNLLSLYHSKLFKLFFKINLYNSFLCFKFDKHLKLKIMEFKGTKGWFIQSDWNGDFYGFKENENGVNYLSIGDENGHDSIHVFSDFTKRHEDGMTELKANALLISKAPEMLDMLIEIRDDCDGNNFSFFRYKIEQLIKEATGL